MKINYTQQKHQKIRRMRRRKGADVLLILFLEHLAVGKVILNVYNFMYVGFSQKSCSHDVMSY